MTRRQKIQWLIAWAQGLGETRVERHYLNLWWRDRFGS